MERMIVTCAAWFRFGSVSIEIRDRSRAVNSTTAKCGAPAGAVAGAVLSVVLIGCTPTVQVALPDKPIEINLNVKIEHDIRVKIDKELDPLFDKNSGLF